MKIPQKFFNQKLTLHLYLNMKEQFKYAVQAWYLKNWAHQANLTILSLYVCNALIYNHGIYLNQLNSHYTKHSLPEWSAADFDMF